MTEQDSLDEGTGYHYTMLEIDGAGYIRGRVWDGTGATFATTGNAVTLNKWNHIWLSYAGGQVTVSLNGNTAVQATISRQSPGVNEYIGVGTYSVTRIAAPDRFRGKFSDLRISNTGETSTFFSTYTNYDMGDIGP
jgi:hypothetical protein